MDNIAEKALEKAMLKYIAGTIEHDGGLDTAPGDLRAWLVHLQEEIIDSLFYIEKILQAMDAEQSDEAPR